MTHKLHYPEGGRCLSLEIFEDAESQEIENIVADIYRWHRRLIAGELRGLETSQEFDAWCAGQAAGGRNVPEIARLVNGELGDLLREHLRRMGHLDGWIEGSGKGEMSVEMFTLQVKTVIDASWPAKTAAKIMQLARPRITDEDVDDWLLAAVARIRNEQDPFEDLHPVDPKTVTRAIARHRKRMNC